ncbi:MAG: PAS domain-containing protein [Sulfuritalea sp.]|nr:PAS domain-containing protein [Sulfuritalea sp.]
MTNRIAAKHPSAVLAGLDLLSFAVLLLDEQLRIRYCNPAAENLFAVSQRVSHGLPVAHLLGAPAVLMAAVENALTHNWSYTGHDFVVAREGARPIHLDCTVTPVEIPQGRLLLEFRPIDQQLKAAREEREAVQQRANQELIRNLAHEIKNPLGGIRGSAQLLDRELGRMDDGGELREYTQVIIGETDRLQDLMHRLLSSHRAMQPAQIGIHEILERVRRLIHAEFPGVRVRRDYDTSLPDITGDREQLIQAILNIVRNAAQAMVGDGEIVMRTRALRQVTLAKKRYRLALELQIIDNGPGIPAEIRDRIFYPLVSGRAGGTGLGLALAQGILQQHHGSIDAESLPGRTCFTLRLPLQNGDKTKK